jgi:hypothetical protein
MTRAWDPKAAARMRKERAATEISILPVGRQSWPGGTWAHCSLTLWPALVFIKGGGSGSHRTDFGMLSFGYIIFNMLVLKEGTRLKMQQEVEGPECNRK